MNYTTAVFLINDTVRAVLGTYEPDKGTTMFKTTDPSIRVGDLVVVPTNTRHMMTVIKITEVDVDVDFDNSTPVDWIIGRIDQTKYAQILDMEAEAIVAIKSAEKTKKRSELLAAILADTEALKSLQITVLGNGTNSLPPPQEQ